MAVLAGLSFAGRAARADASIVDENVESGRRTSASEEKSAGKQKTPDISPIFKADSVMLGVSREKDGKLRLAYARWDYAKIVRPSAMKTCRGVVSFPLRTLAREGACVALAERHGHA